MPTFAERLGDALEPWMTPSLAILCDAIGTMFQPVDNLVQDVAIDGDPDYVPGWGTVFDVTACPTGDLPYLGQFGGVEVPTGADDATARALIEAEAGINRGKPDAIKSAVKRHLSGTQTLTLRERTAADGNPDAYHAVIEVRTAEVLSLTAMQAAVQAVKPARIQLTYVVTDGWTVGELEAAETHVSDVEADFATVDDVEFDLT